MDISKLIALLNEYAAKAKELGPGVIDAVTGLAKNIQDFIGKLGNSGVMTPEETRMALAAAGAAVDAANRTVQDAPAPKIETE